MALSIEPKIKLTQKNKQKNKKKRNSITTKVDSHATLESTGEKSLRGVEWVHGLFLFPLVLGKMKLPHAKIGSFLCSLDNLLQKNVIVLFFGNQISKMALI